MSTNSSGLCMGCMSPLGDYIVCPRCGYDNGTPYDKLYRKPGSVLGGRYIVGRLVHKNGEGAVYVGFDNNLQAKVWVREYFPHTIASRDPLTGDIIPREGCGPQFKALMSDFVDICNEVKRMGVTEPVIPIENVIGDHGTVCAIYKDLQVMRLENWLVAKGGKLPVKEARELLLPLFNTLSNIHARGVIHRGISPYTVYIDEFGKLYLWDFCLSATRTGGSELEAELFNGYSAPEQYSSTGWQGTWTDVYGAAALFYRAVSGFVPPKSTLIGDQRPLAPLIDLVMDLPHNISDAVADAMNPVAELRTQEIGPFVSRLVQTNLSSTAVYDVSMVNEVKKRREEKLELRAEKRRRGKYVALGLLITVVVLGVSIWFVMTTQFSHLISRDQPAGPSSARTGDDEDPTGEEGGEDPTEDEADKAIPNFIGMVAEEILQDAAYTDRFRFTVEEDFNAEYEKGVVYGQSPRAGLTVLDGRNVVLQVSKGKQVVKMPDLTGMTREEVLEALDALKEAMGTDVPVDFTINEYTRYSKDAEPGTVVSFTPATDTEFDPRSTTINIFYQMENQTSEAIPKETEPPTEKETSERETSRMTQDEFLSRWNQ